jgi:leader peptidase (prepilin peptidase)/N-methyltransferase
MAVSEAAALAAFAAPLGAVIGSFLNVVIHRLPLGQSLSTPRSHCPACKQPIRPLDNVPVLSWLVLRGRCRACGVSIAVRYPLVELVTALAFAAVVLTRGAGAELWAFLPFTAVLIAVAGIDLDHRIVPNKIMLPAAVWALATAALLRTDQLPELLIAGSAAFALLLLAALAYPAGMGMGDVKLAGVMGLYLGSAIAPALLVAFATGTAAGLYALAREGSAARKKAVPFAPFLALGGFVGIVAGPELVDLYVTKFL